MIPIKEAVSAAKTFVKDIFEDNSLAQLRVEEIESTDDDRYWMVTLGWNEPAVKTFNSILGTQSAKIEALPRVYKIFTIDSATGKVESMKMREDE